MIHDIHDNNTLRLANINMNAKAKAKAKAKERTHHTNYDDDNFIDYNYDEHNSDDESTLSCAVCYNEPTPQNPFVFLPCCEPLTSIRKVNTNVYVNVNANANVNAKASARSFLTSTSSTRFCKNCIVKIMAHGYKCTYVNGHGRGHGHGHGRKSNCNSTNQCTSMVSSMSININNNNNNKNKNKNKNTITTTHHLSNLDSENNNTGIDAGTGSDSDVDIYTYEGMGECPRCHQILSIRIYEHEEKLKKCKNKCECTRTRPRQVELEEHRHTCENIRLGDHKREHGHEHEYEHCLELQLEKANISQIIQHVMEKKRHHTRMDTSIRSILAFCAYCNCKYMSQMSIEFLFAQLPSHSISSKDALKQLVDWGVLEKVRIQSKACTSTCTDTRTWYLLFLSHYLSIIKKYMPNNRNHDTKNGEESYEYTYRMLPHHQIILKEYLEQQEFKDDRDSLREALLLTVEHIQSTKIQHLTLGLWITVIPIFRQNVIKCLFSYAKNAMVTMFWIILIVRIVCLVGFTGMAILILIPILVLIMHAYRECRMIMFYCIT